MKKSPISLFLKIYSSYSANNAGNIFYFLFYFFLFFSSVLFVSSWHRTAIGSQDFSCKYKAKELTTKLVLYTSYNPILHLHFRDEQPEAWRDYVIALKSFSQNSKLLKQFDYCSHVIPIIISIYF